MHVISYFNSKLEQYSLGIIEVYVLLGDVHSNQGPVDLQVEGNQQQSFGKHIHLERQDYKNSKNTMTTIKRVAKSSVHFTTQHKPGNPDHSIFFYIYLFCPPLYSFIAFCYKLFVKETVEKMDLQKKSGKSE